MSYLLVNGRVVDPGRGIDSQLDIRLAEHVIEEVDEGLAATRQDVVIDLSGLTVVPGIIDSHVHLSGSYVGRDLHRGHRMLARAGVTAAMDLAADGSELIGRSREHGAGLSVGFLVPAVPDETLPADASRSDIEHFLDGAAAEGAMGAKLLGGHYPLSPETMDSIIAECDSRGLYVAIHAGSTTTGSNIEGVVEAIDIAAGRPIHLAHINSYCRGQINPDIIAECVVALNALKAAHGVRSESYLSRYNGCSAEYVLDEPKSEVLRACLVKGGYPTTRAGMLRAIKDGWANIHVPDDGQRTVLASGESGVSAFRDADSDVGVSFPVNDPLSITMCALARRPDGGFVVDALSTDGGGVPRNTLVEQGLALVRSGMLTFEDFVSKASVNPAKMLGWSNKGRIAAGADGDLTVLDVADGRAAMAFARGQMIMHRGDVLGAGMHLMSAASSAE